MKFSRYASACLAFAVTLTLLSSCKGQEGGQDNSDSAGSDSAPATVVVNGSVVEPTTGNADISVEPETAPEAVTVDTPTAGSYEPTNETVITLGETATVTGAGAVADGSAVTVTAAGTYLIQGSTANGQLIVDRGRARRARVSVEITADGGRDGAGGDPKIQTRHDSTSLVHLSL